MKRLILTALLAVAVLAFGASPATAKKARCSKAATVRALPAAQSTGGTLPLYYVERCGRRVSPLFG